MSNNVARSVLIQGYDKCISNDLYLQMEKERMGDHLSL